MIDAVICDRMALMLNGGVRPDGEVLIAFCFDAKLVFLGWPTLYGLVAGGESGARNAMSILKRDIDLTLAQIGCSQISQLGPNFLLLDPDDLRYNRIG